MKTMVGFFAAVIVAIIVLPTPAAAQGSGINLMTPPQQRPQTEAEKQKRAEEEKAYEEQLRRIPDQKTSNDPWGKVRNVDSPPAKKNRQETGSK